MTTSSIFRKFQHCHNKTIPSGFFSFGPSTEVEECRFLTLVEWLGYLTQPSFWVAHIGVTLIIGWFIFRIMMKALIWANARWRQRLNKSRIEEDDDSDDAWCFDSNTSLQDDSPTPSREKVLKTLNESLATLPKSNETKTSTPQPKTTVSKKNSTSTDSQLMANPSKTPQTPVSILSSSRKTSKSSSASSEDKK